MIQSSGSGQRVKAQRREWICPRSHSPLVPELSPAVLGLMLPLRQVLRDLASKLSDMRPFYSGSSGMGQESSGAGKTPLTTVSPAPVPMPSFQPGRIFQKEVPKRRTFHSAEMHQGACPWLWLNTVPSWGFLPGAGVISGASNGSWLHEGKHQPVYHWASCRGTGSASVARMKAGHTQSQMPMETSRGLQCSFISWATF